MNLDIDENIEGINRKANLQNTHHKQLATEEKLSRLHENRRKSTLQSRQSNEKRNDFLPVGLARRINNHQVLDGINSF
jgi:hypothetical protein